MARLHNYILQFAGLLLVALCLTSSAMAQKSVILPSFDIVRVGPDGFAVMAGRGPAKAEISIYDGDKFISKTRSNGQGEWAIITETPLAVGDRKLSLKAKLPGGDIVDSDQVLVVAVRQRGVAGTGDGGTGATTMALLLSKRPGGVSRLLQKPEPEKGLSQTELSLAQLSYSKKSPLSLQGTGRPGAVIRIYVDNRHIGDAKAGKNGDWRHQVKNPLLKTEGKTERRLRLDQIDDGGKVDARIEVGFGNEEEIAAKADPVKKTSQKKIRKSGSTKLAGKKAAKLKVAVARRPAATKKTATAAKSAGDGGRGQNGFVVRRGQNLWRIAQEIYGEGTKYTVIFRANKSSIRDPNKIYPGQILKLPK